MLHWGLAVPFVLLYSSALLLFITWGEAQPRTFHQLAGWIHRGAGACLVVLPPLALLLGRRDWRVHLANIREAWVWNRDDVRWLLLCARAARDPRIVLPDQGKFNAAEKLNFIMVQVCYPLYVATGIWIWLPGVAFLAWVAHFTAAVLGAPLVLGHIFMATVNPSTRIGLQGMISGWVDREWAKHHYRRWYRETFERPEQQTPPPPNAGGMIPLLKQSAIVRCTTCNETASFGTWEQLVRRAFQVEPIFCPNCDAELLIVSAQATPEVVAAILEHIESGHAHEPFNARASQTV